MVTTLADGGAGALMRNGDFIFRPATLADSERIASLHTDSWRDAYPGILPEDYLDGPIAQERARLWQARLASRGADRRYVLLVESEEGLVGFVCVLLDEEPGWGACLDNLHVLPKLKGHGLGRQLFSKAAEWVMSKEPGWPMHLWVFEENHRARRFYEALGGEVVERRFKQTPAGVKIASLCYVWRDLSALAGTFS
jgi:GNAT superfamily N-acetyltransferase